MWKMLVCGILEIPDIQLAPVVLFLPHKEEAHPSEDTVGDKQTEAESSPRASG